MCFQGTNLLMVSKHKNVLIHGVHSINEALPPTNWIKFMFISWLPRKDNHGQGRLAFIIDRMDIDNSLEAFFNERVSGFKPEIGQQLLRDVPLRQLNGGRESSVTRFVDLK